MEQRLHQLARDAEREAGLELAAASAQDPQARVLGERVRRAQQARLPEPSGRLEHEQRPGAAADALQRVVQGALFHAPLQ